MKLSVLDITYHTRVNGPGLRNIVHLAGCRIRCPGCFSQHTWNKQAGKLLDTQEVLQALMQNAPEGVSISGGEPLEQAPALLELVKELWFKNLPLGVLLFTGIDASSLNQIDEWADIKKYVDAVVAGPYKQDLAISPVRGLVSSSNQKVLYTGYKITPDMLSSLPSVEVKITPTGSKLLGFPSTGSGYVSVEKT